MTKHFCNLFHTRKRCGGAAAFCLVLALAAPLSGSLTACRKAAPENIPESSAQLLPTQADPIAHPDVLLDGMKGSVLYDYAVEQGAVILCNGMAATSGNLPRAFFDGETDRLEVVNFTRFTSSGEEFMRAYSLRFCRTGGGDAIAYNDNELDDWQAEPTYGEEAELAVMTLNEYGFLNYAQPFESETSGLRVIHPAELCPDYAVTQALYDEYLAPLYFTALNTTWSSPSELGSWIWIFEDVYNNENGRDPWQEFGENWPVDSMVETLSRYFDGVTAANIIADHRGGYDPAANTIFYEGGRGGLSPTYQVLASQQEDDVLAILYEERDYLTGAPLPDSCRALRVRPLDDGSFRALSNLPAERPQPLELSGDALYQDILVNFGAGPDTASDAPAPLRISPVSLFYLEPTGDLSAAEPDVFFSWYLNMAAREELTDAQRLEKYASPYGEDTGWFFPQEYYEPLVEQYFGVSAERLRSGSAYRPAEQGYWLDGGPGIGMRPYVLFDRAEVDGDLLHLHLALIPTGPEAGYANQAKVLTVRTGGAGGYRYLSYLDDGNPSEAQQTAGRQDSTGAATGMPAEYVNEALGLRAAFPDAWADNYTAKVSETYFMELDDETGPYIQFCYKDNSSGVLGSITGVPRDSWEVVSRRDPPIGTYIGESDDYVFVADGAWRNPFPDGSPDAGLFDRLTLSAEELAALVTLP